MIVLHVSHICVKRALQTAFKMIAVFANIWIVSYWKLVKDTWNTCCLVFLCSKLSYKFIHILSIPSWQISLLIVWALMLLELNLSFVYEIKLKFPISNYLWGDFQIV